MNSVKLSREELKARENLKNISNRIRLQYSMGRIKTFRDLLTQFGWNEPLLSWTYFPSEQSRLLTFKDTVDYLDDRRIELETAQWLKRNPPQLNHEDNSIAIRFSIEQTQRREEIKKEKKENDYGLKPSPKENVSFFWFQKKAIVEGYNNVINEQKRCQLIVAGTGTGKTFIAGGLFRRLHDINFHKGRSISPWPYVYITKASVVEQTKRVFKNFFNLGERELFVTNIEQLRSTAGELWINERIRVVNGEEEYIYEWRDLIHPLVIAIDECQLAKNGSTTQSRIIQAFADIKKEVYMIWLSATPFTKVIEAKAFVLNCHLTYDIVNPLKVKPQQLAIDI